MLLRVHSTFDPKQARRAGLIRMTAVACATAVVYRAWPGPKF